MIEMTALLETVGHFSERGNCSLCQEGADSPLTPGFALPEGLRRHLSGYGNVNRCVVFDAAHLLVLEGNREKFDRNDRDNESKKALEIQQRRETEILFQVAPYRNPELIESTSYRSPRKSEQLVWAENRLDLLGFEIQKNNNVWTHTKEVSDFIVYADIRSSRDIQFSVYSKQSLKKHEMAADYRRFNIPDTWKYDFQEKFRIRCEKAIEDLNK